MITMRRTFAALILAVFSFGPSIFSQAPAAAPAQAMRGYTPARAAAQRETERAFQALPSADRITEWPRYFTSVPHPASTTSRLKTVRLLSIIARRPLSSSAGFRA